MSSRLRSGVFWLLAVALLLRATLPSGFMPAAGEGFGLVLCTPQGLLAADPAAEPSGEADPDAGMECPFALLLAPAIGPYTGATAEFPRAERHFLQLPAVAVLSHSRAGARFARGPPASL